MKKPRKLNEQLQVRPNFAVTSTSLLVAMYGIYVIAETLLEQLVLHHHGRFNRSIVDINLDLSLLLGISVIYLSLLLRRRKRTAWVVTVLAYTFYLGVGLSQLLNNRMFISHHWILPLTKVVIFPIIILTLLYTFRKEFVVKSDISGFRSSLFFILALLMITIIYGVAGFMLMDKSDFHQEIGLPSAIHYTVDQFDLTVAKPIHPYTKRAKLFVDSLSFVSLISLIYAALSLFQPLRFRLSDQSGARQKTEELLNKYGDESEEFFKIWPHDKQYFFDDTGESVLAFHVHRGVALVLSDPAGDEKRFVPLLAGFLNLCFYNDWLPSFIHVSEDYYDLYEKSGFTLQKLGQEAVVDIDHFQANLKDSKYFRQILNKFNKQGYSYELLKPPHHKAVLERFKFISDEWLSKGNRSERGFALGYYTDEYMQLCEIAVARDAAGTIQGFLNLIPASFDKAEATYDMIRQSDKAPGNIVDFLLVNIISDLQQRGYARLNMGLCPLAGLKDDNNEEKTLLDNVLRLIYANGDRFFSFSGLYRFKSKYEPSWQNRYVAYKGGIPGLSRALIALTRYMTKSVHLH